MSYIHDQVKEFTNTVSDDKTVFDLKEALKYACPNDKKNAYIALYKHLFELYDNFYDTLVYTNGKKITTSSRFVDDDYNVIFEISNHRTVYDGMHSVICSNFNKYINGLHKLTHPEDIKHHKLANESQDKTFKNHNYDGKYHSFRYTPSSAACETHGWNPSID